MKNNTIEKIDAKKELIFFDYYGNSIRVYGTNDNPWFMAKDIAEIMGYKDISKAIKEHVKNEDKINSTNLNSEMLMHAFSLAFHPNGILINENGLLSLIYSNPKAKGFQSWITNEVIPRIKNSN